jgi:hypothetical protein
VSRAVATVEALGYVTRQPDPGDARAFLLSLTARGEQFLAEQHRGHARRVAAVLESWDDAKARAVLAGLTELDTALGRTVADMRTGGIPDLMHMTPLADSVADDTQTQDQDEKAYA